MACTEAQCLYKGALYLTLPYLTLHFLTGMHLLVVMTICVTYPAPPQQGQSCSHWSTTVVSRPLVTNTVCPAAVT